MKKKKSRKKWVILIVSNICSIKVMALEFPKIFRKIEVSAFLNHKQTENKCDLSLKKAE